MALVLITNKPKEHSRPSMEDSEMFVPPQVYGGGLKRGNYMKNSCTQSNTIVGLVDENTVLIGRNDYVDKGA